MGKEGLLQASGLASERRNSKQVDSGRGSGAPGRKRPKTLRRGSALADIVDAAAAGGDTEHRSWDRLRVLAQTRQILSGLVETKDRALEEALVREERLRQKFQLDEDALRRSVAVLREELAARHRELIVAKARFEHSELRAHEMEIQLRALREPSTDEPTMRAQMCLLEVRLARATERTATMRSFTTRNIGHVKARVAALVSELNRTRAEISSRLDGFGAWLAFQTSWVWGRAQLSRLAAESTNLGTFVDMMQRFRTAVDKLLVGVNSMLKQYQMEQQFGDRATFKPVDLEGQQMRRRRKSLKEKEGLQSGDYKLEDTDATREVLETRRMFDDLVDTVSVCSARCKFVANVVSVSQGAESLRPLAEESVKTEAALHKDYNLALSELAGWVARGARPMHIATLQQAVRVYRDSLVGRHSEAAADRAEQILSEAHQLIPQAVTIIIHRVRMRVQYQAIREKLLTEPVKPAQVRRRTRHASRPGSRQTTMLDLTPDVRGWDDASPPVQWVSSPSSKRRRRKHARSRSRSPTSPGQARGRTKEAPTRERGVQTEADYQRCLCGAKYHCIDCTAHPKLEMVFPPALNLLLRTKRAQLEKLHVEYSEILKQLAGVVRSMLQHLKDIRSDETAAIAQDEEPMQRDTGGQARVQELLSMRMPDEGAGDPPSLPAELPILVTPQQRMWRQRWEEQLRGEMAREQRRREALREIAGECVRREEKPVAVPAPPPPRAAAPSRLTGWQSRAATPRQSQDHKQDTVVVDQKLGEMYDTSADAVGRQRTAPCAAVDLAAVLEEAAAAPPPCPVPPHSIVASREPCGSRGHSRGGQRRSPCAPPAGPVRVGPLLDARECTKPRSPRSPQGAALLREDSPAAAFRWNSGGFGAVDFGLIAARLTEFSRSRTEPQQTPRWRLFSQHNKR